MPDHHWSAARIKQQITSELLEIGVRPGAVLLVHSSLRALGWNRGGPEPIIQGIIEALGPAGTLLMPALSYDLVTPVQPLFDIKHTPSNVGALSEYFRTRPGTRRSLHPTHSVCGLGPLASQLLDSHHLDNTPCGPNSAFHLLPQLHGQILMLGCGLKPNTSMHAIEELIDPPYLFAGLLAYRLRVADGQEWEQTYRRHGFAGWIQRYDRVETVMEEPALRRGRVLQADVHLLEAAVLWPAALAALQQDALYFVDRA
jgi:aminoglycoside 3-N-acetyltransferase